MNIESVEQTNGLDLGDAAVIGIVWPNESNNLALHLLLSSGTKAILTCFWFTNLRIDLDFKDLSRSLTWDVRFTRSDKGIWHVEFDFGGTPRGVIELDCNGITFLEEKSEQSLMGDAPEAATEAQC